MNFKDTEIGRIPFEWDVRMIQDVAEVVSGATPKTKVAEYWDGNIAWITPKDLSNHTERYIYRGDRMITDEGLKNSSAKLLPKGSVLFSSRAPIGYTAIAAQELCTNQGFKSMICNQQILDNNFMFYMMNYKKNEIENIAGGSTFKEVSGKTVKEFKIPIPPLDEQKAIAKVLSDLDEKIETNNKINKKLEEMAQAIFKQWFVDFEFPNEDGKPYKSSGGEMVESELGMIPKGWNIKKLSELADMKNGVNYGRNQEGEKVKVVNVRDFDGSLVVNDKKLDNVFLLQKQINDYRLQKYDTVIVRSAKPGETLLVNDDNLKVYSGFTIRIRPKDYNIKLYVFYCIRNSIRQLENSSNGTIFKNLNQQLLGKVSVIEPKIEVINKYNDFIKTIIDKIYIVNEEINRLTDLRDTLLPKLMSGEIRVPVEN